VCRNNRKQTMNQHSPPTEFITLPRHGWGSRFFARVASVIAQQHASETVHISRTTPPHRAVKRRPCAGQWGQFESSRRGQFELTMRPNGRARCSVTCSISRSAALVRLHSEGTGTHEWYPITLRHHEDLSLMGHLNLTGPVRSSAPSSSPRCQAAGCVAVRTKEQT
jgi:hypothetical protein